MPHDRFPTPMALASSPLSRRSHGSRGHTYPPATSSVCAAMHNMRGIRGQQRQFRSLFERSLVPMVTVDNTRRYLTANAAARLLFRLNLAELRERRIDDLTPSDMVDILNERWAKLIRDGGVAGPYDVDFPDGSSLRVVYCALANVLPGEHLIVFAPAGWPEDELGEVRLREGRSRSLGLSPRELDVLKLAATGADLRRIAAELTIAPSTVRTHTQNALRKLGARNRTHAIALAMQAGLIDLPTGGADDDRASST